MSKKLIAFYSRADENYVNGMIKNLTIGNTEVVAGIIKELTQADTFKMNQIQAYSTNYNECIEQAQSDQKRDARPELKSYPDSIDDYDVRIEEMLDWYSDIVWDESAKSLNPRELAHKYLGEVALVGDDPCMPTLLADFLFAKLKYASMHMG